jgi:hypothetical protein
MMKILMLMMILQVKHNIDILVNSTDTRFTTQNQKRALVEDDKEEVSKNNKQLSIINAFSQQPTINQGMLI